MAAPAPSAAHVVTCATCKKKGPQHRRTTGCAQDPDTNPWPKWNADPLECDFCQESHEPSECLQDKGKTNDGNHSFCGKCGHAWHTRKTCLLRADIDSQLEQYTRSKYAKAKERRDTVEERRKVEELGAQSSSSKRPASASPASSPPKSRPSASGSFMNLSELSKSLQGQSSQPNQRQRPAQTQTRTRPPAASREEIQQREKEEAAVKKANRQKWTEASLRLPGYPRQDQFPQSGNNKIKANLFQVNIENLGIDLRRYHVNFGQMPSRDRSGKITWRDVVKPNLKRAMINQMLTAHVPAAVYATDYFCYIISAGRLYADCGDVVGDTVTKDHPLTSANADLPPLVMNSSIVYDRAVNLRELDRFMRRTPGRDVNYHPGEDLKSLNIISWQMIFPDSFPGGRVGNKFYPENLPTVTVHVPNKGHNPIWDLHSGFFSSMRPADGNLLLNVNCTTSVFFHHCILQSWISSIEYLKSTAQVLGDLRGVKVTFVGDTNIPPKKRAICSIERQRVDVKTFALSEGGNITVWKHMSNVYADQQATYNCRPTAWCVNLGGMDVGKQRWYPADMLEICLWQPAGHKARTEITTDMLKLATQDPSVNQTSLLHNASPHLGIIPLKQHYQAFGLNVTPSLLSLNKIKRLDPPRLEFRNGRCVQTQSQGTRKNPATWSLETIAKKLKDPQDDQGFAVIGNAYPTLFVINNFPEHETAKKFVKLLRDNLADYGLTTSQYRMQDITILQRPNPRVQRADLTALMNDAVSALKRKSNGENPPLVVVLLSNPKKTNPILYSNIKWWGDCVSGLPTVCVSSDGIKRGAKSDLNLIANIALKINFKLGGISHRVSVTADSVGVANLGVQPRTMIMGADVTHVGKGQDGGCPSQAGVVATQDDNYVHYLASARLQPHNTEFIEGLQGMVEERLEVYHEKNGYLPAHILFYRDGVGETQYGMVYEEELPQIRAACANMSTQHGENQPVITLLVVGKRHHVRFFPNDPGTRFNLSAGTVVDRDVTDPNRTNFYLQSHDSALGTARTAHYVVIIDETGYGLERLERITNAICFTGSRATKGLSICTPAKYADILCTRLRCYMQPALTGQVHGASVDHYRQNNVIWGSATGNPWHAGVNDIMFYL